MSRKGLLVDHDYPVGRGGINLCEILTERPDKTYRIDYVPFTTMYCYLCAARTAKGEQPACVKHCQASPMYYGDVTEMAKIMEEGSRCVLFTPR